MELYKTLKPESVFKYFCEIAKIPHGSRNLGKINKYCLEFAEKNSLKAEKDDAGNIVIWKDASSGYENHEPIILQAHLDMVCQKTEESNIDFLNDGLELYVDGDFIKAKDTTLGADDGIGVAMILAILADKTLNHPPIEAVFTADEEIGMLGAGALDYSKLTAKRMINLDSGNQTRALVSCAGGIDFIACIPLVKTKKNGKKITICLHDLLGGHSGEQINKGRINGGMLAGRVLHTLSQNNNFDLISVNGGDKGNAIIPNAQIELVAENGEEFIKNAKIILEEIKEEISDREPNFNFEIKANESSKFSVLTEDEKESVIYLLTTMPNGVLDMSMRFSGLVETSLNLGILKTGDNELMAHFVLRSLKDTALSYLAQKLCYIAKYNNWKCETDGYYPPWEYKENSDLQKKYTEVFEKEFGQTPTIEAVHAGLEGGIFSSNIKGLDCIALGPNESDVHTVFERLSISSTEVFYNFLLQLLKSL